MADEPQKVQPSSDQTRSYQPRNLRFADGESYDPMAVKAPKVSMPYGAKKRGGLSFN